MSIRVVLADDQPLVRPGLRVLIADTPDLDVAAEAATGAQAVALARDLHPDVVVMDIRMPVMDGIEATRMITTDPCPARVVVLTTFDDDDPPRPRCAPGRAGSWSRTSSRMNCCRGSGSWRGATRCSPPA